MTRPLVLLSAALALLAGCAGGGSTVVAPLPSGPSGSLGVVTAQAAAEAVSAVCLARRAKDRDTANGLFYDRAHATLHALSAATEEIDRIPAAQVLETMQRVEADLQSEALPPTFAEDVDALLEAMRSALATVGLPAPGC